MNSQIELVEVDPGSLLIGANVRADGEPGRALVASIRERGVLQPVVAYRDDTGQLVVLRGQRRTLAAVKAGRATVPVGVVPRPDDVDRLVDQLSENEHRLPVAPADRAATYVQLAGFGLSAAAIARQTAARRGDVDAGLAVAASKAAQKAMQRHRDLTLDQAAAIAEFDGDDLAVKRLLTAAKAGQFDHEAQRLRDARAEADAIAQAAQPLLDAGVTVLDRGQVDHRTTTSLSDLVDAGTGKKVTPGRHVKCPGHAAYLTPQYRGASDTPSFVPVYVCVDYRKHGHVRSWEYGKAGKTAGRTDEQRDVERVERRDVIAGNKAWRSAEAVRLKWLREFLARKSAPKDAATFVAGSLVCDGWQLRHALEQRHTLAHELFGLGEKPAYGQPAKLPGLLDGASEARALMVTLGLVLAAHEDALGLNAWRSPSSEATRYLRYLEAQGYTLSDVELRARGQPPAPDGCTQDTPAGDDAEVEPGDG